MPYQMGAFQNGNVAAQNQYIRGVPGYNNAILGMQGGSAPTAYRGTMPDASMYSVQLPDFGQPQAPAAGQSWQNTAQGQQEPYAQMLSQLLGGRF
jgi:hypothetical protein